MTIENANIYIDNAHLAKVAVVGSNPIARSIFFARIQWAFSVFSAYSGAWTMWSAPPPDKYAA